MIRARILKADFVSFLFLLYIYWICIILITQLSLSTVITNSQMLHNQHQAYYPRAIALYLNIVF